MLGGAAGAAAPGAPVAGLVVGRFLDDDDDDVLLLEVKMSCRYAFLNLE